jgi:hypothetical protein
MVEPDSGECRFGNNSGSTMMGHCDWQSGTAATHRIRGHTRATKPLAVVAQRKEYQGFGQGEVMPPSLYVLHCMRVPCFVPCV